MTVEITRLSNGLRVVSQHMPHLRTVALGMWVASGARHEHDREHGISHLLEHMAFKGTARRTAQDIAEEIEHLLPARAYVQTTRILREAVSNIIKHSSASHCKVRSSVGERDFGLLVQDNGKGIAMELDGKLDRGHGMSSMKHRAKQLQGQCLVESGPGYGTVIRLTLPL